MNDDDIWFEPKRYGYGAGLPIAWQGWALVLGFCAAIILLAVVLAPRQPLLFSALALILAVPLMVISAQHTRGGWRWRWGGD